MQGQAMDTDHKVLSCLGTMGSGHRGKTTLIQRFYQDSIRFLI
jgi:GTPase SAR1 family protein